MTLLESTVLSGSQLGLISSELISFEGLRTYKLVYIIIEVVERFLDPEMTPR